jgi:hypothetical protein
VIVVAVETAFSIGFLVVGFGPGFGTKASSSSSACSKLR